MDSEVYNILESVAADLDLEIVETTTERSGYPKNLWYSLIGFKDETHYQDAQKALADAVADYKKGTQDQDGIACDLSVRAQVLQKRDGHDLWTVNQTTFCGFIDLFDLMHVKREDDRITAVYTAADADDEDDFVSNLKGVIDGMTSFGDIREVVDRYEKYKEIIEDLEENQMLVIDTYGNHEVLPIKASSYHDDATSYSVALTVILD